MIYIVLTLLKLFGDPLSGGIFTLELMLRVDHLFFLLTFRIKNQDGTRRRQCRDNNTKKMTWSGPQPRPLEQP